MARRRSNSHQRPLIPGFWPFLAALALLFSTFGYVWIMARSTHLSREAPAVKQASR